MAAKKSSSKQVTVTIDHETLQTLVGALRAIADVGNAVEMGADSAGRAGLAKTAKKSAKKRR